MAKAINLMDVKNFFSIPGYPVTAKEMKELSKEDKDELKVLLAQAPASA